MSSARFHGELRGQLWLAPPHVQKALAGGRAGVDRLLSGLETWLGVFAEFETNLRRERQLEGIAKAKAEGKYKGRPASINAAKVRAMKAEGLGASEIAKALKIGRASVYRLMERLGA